MPPLPPGALESMMNQFEESLDDPNSNEKFPSVLHMAISMNAPFNDIKRAIERKPATILRRAGRHDGVVFPQFVTVKPSIGSLPFHFAAQLGRLDVVKLLLESRKEGIHFDIDDDGMSEGSSCTMSKTAFYVAVQHNHIGVARFLKRAGANVNFESKDFSKGIKIGSALFCCATGAQDFPGIKMAKCLCDEFGVNPNTRGYCDLYEEDDKFEQYPVLIAAVRRLVKMYICEYPLSSNPHEDERKKMRDCQEMMNLLLDKGADVNIRGVNGETTIFELTKGLNGIMEAGPDLTFIICMFVRKFGASIKYKYTCTFREEHQSVTLREMVALMISSNSHPTIYLRQMQTLLADFKACAHGGSSHGRLVENQCDQEAKKKCQRCKTVRYCCTEHQRVDWKNGHRETCQEIIAYRDKVEKVKQTGGCAIIKIQLVGLISKPEFNGLIGTRSTFDNITKRYLFVFDDDTLPCVNVKEKNFFVVLDDDTNDDQSGNSGRSTTHEKKSSK